MKKIYLFIPLFFLFVSCNNSTTVNAPPTPENARQTQSNALALPLDRALDRITKKPFGIKISPGDSPISPERFSGYHTGTDFETFPEEQDQDIKVLAVCTGTLLQKSRVSGYGGVAVQSCQIDNQPVTIIYGHLKLSSIEIFVNQTLAAGDTIGILGAGYSTDTDGERKHLHLGIHRGDQINVRGYVASSSELSDWLDAKNYLK